MAIEIVTGKEATIYFDAQKCIHSRSCVRSHPDVFVPNVVGAWIHPDAQPMGELVRIAQNCPSGTSTVMRHGAGTTNSADSNGYPNVNTVRVRENGPLALEAELLIGCQTQTRPRATLCRCGQSRKKSYCDSGHKAARFATV